MKNKIITLILGCIFVLSCCVFTSAADDNTMTINVSDPPQVGNVDLLVTKHYQNGHKSTNPLEGAVFEVKHYGNDRGNTSGTVLHTWYFETEDIKPGTPPETDGKYGIKGNNPKITRQAGYTSDSLIPYDNVPHVWPLGTYTIKEVKEPEGYQINTDPARVLVVKYNPNGNKFDALVQDGEGNEWTHDIDESNIIEPSNDWMAIEINKADLDKKELTAQGDGSLAGIKFAVVLRDCPEQYEFVYHDQPEVSRSNGEVVEILTTDENGYAITKPSTKTEQGKDPKYNLRWGTYEVIELRQDANIHVGDNYDTADKGTSIYANNSYLFSNIRQKKECKEHEDVFTFGNYTVSPGSKTSFANPVVEGGITLRKVDEDRNVTDRETNKPQGDALLGNGSANAEISIYNISDLEVVNKDGARIPSGKSSIDVAGRSGYADKYLVQKIYTNAQGVASTGATDLPYGTYVAIETTPSRGYFNNDNWYVTFQIREQGVVINVNTSEKVAPSKAKDAKSGWLASSGTVGTSVKQALSEKVYRGGVNVQKINEELNAAQNEGTSFLEGNKFNIVNASLQDVYVEGKWYGKVADKDSSKTSWTKNSVKRVTNITRDELIAAKNAVGENGAVVKTITTDKMGFAETDLRTLPYGTYYIYEAETNSSMRLDEDWVLRIEVREDSKIIDTTQYPAENPIVRGDLYFTKVDEDGVRRPNTPFLIVAYDPDGKIAESHVIVTDSSGIASTAFIYNTTEEDNMLETTQVERKHSSNTNKFDQYVKKNADGSYKVTEEGEALLASGEASTYGVWFTQGLNPENNKIVKGSKAAVDDSRGALYYGTYQIFEVQCKENADLGEDLLISKKFTIKNKDQVYNANGDLMHEEDRNVKEKQLKYADAFVDLEVLLSTVAKDVVTDSQVTFANANVVLEDTISFSNIKATSTYKWVVDFVETENGNVLSEVTIDQFKPETTNNAVQTTNQPKFSFTVNTKGEISPAKNLDGTVNKGYVGEPVVTSTGNVDTTGLDGKSISAVVYLYEYITGYDFDNDDDYKEFEALNFITAHNIDRTDENEKIYVPKMVTTASDVFTKDHVGTKYNIGENYDDISRFDAIIDNVTVNNLAPKEKYMLVEYLWDATNNERFGEDQITYKWYSDRDQVSHIDEWKVEMEPFKVESKDFEDKTLVVMEELWRVDNFNNKIDDIPVITHVDTADEDQSVHYIDIDTDMVDEFTGDHVGTIGERVKLTDTVTLKNLVKGMDYTVKGVLVYQADCTDVNGVSHKAGDPVATLDGSTTELTYTAKEYGDAQVEIVYYVDSRDLEGIDVVSTEYAYHNDILIDKHVDLEDKTQTVEFPKLRTVAADGKTADNVGTVMPDGTLTDTVQLWNLIAGEEYTVDGTLVYQDDGTPVEGVESHSYTFVPTEDQTEFHEIKIEFTGIDSTKLAGRSVVVFEKLYHPNEETGEPVEINRHEDLKDKPQTVHYPSIFTQAVDSRTGDQVGSIFGKAINEVRNFFGANILAEDETEIIDNVHVGNLVPGETYTVTGVLMDKDTGELLNGKEYTATATIQVGEGTITGTNGEKTTVIDWNVDKNAVSGTVEVTFRLGTEEVTDKTVVCFEKLFHNNAETGEPVEITKHEDINDRNQFVNLIDVDSTAVEKITGTHLGDTPGSALETSTIVEHFDMKKLVNGADYKVDFALVVVEDSEIAGKPIYLTPDGSFSENREDAIRQIVDVHALAEKETSGWKVIINDELKYEAETYDAANAWYEEYYNGLSEEEKATVKSTIINDYNEPVADPDEFSAASTLEVEFVLDKESVGGKSVIVVADVFHNDVMVATHSNIKNEEETVHYPAIETIAEQGDSELDFENHVTRIFDSVNYYNLIPGVEYTLEARGVNPETGEVTVDKEGNEYVFTKTFTPTEPNGTEVVELEFDQDDIIGPKLVCFERLYVNYNNPENPDPEKPDTPVYPDGKEIVISKETVDSEELPGAHMVLTDKDGNVVDVWVSETTPHTVKLDAGDYYLEETVAPEGYVVITKFGFTVDADGNVTTTSTEAKCEDGAHLTVIDHAGDNPGPIEVARHEDINDENQTVELYQSVKITVTKKSAGTEYKLKGAEITVFDKNGKVIKDRFDKKAVGKTDKDGVIVFEILAYKNQEYYVQETKAPKGYELNKDKFKLERDEKGNLEGDIDIEILDTMIIIPPTGDNNYYMVYLALLILALMSVGGATAYKVRRKRQ